VVGLGPARCCPAYGSSTTNRDPAPGSLSTRITPPCAFTICAVMYRPRPRPVAALMLPIRSNGRNRRSTASRAIPIPWSSTTSLAICSSPSTTTRTGLPRPYFPALDSRFVATCSSRTRSQRPRTDRASTVTGEPLRARSSVRFAIARTTSARSRSSSVSASWSEPSSPTSRRLATRFASRKPSCWSDASCSTVIAGCWASSTPSSDTSTCIGARSS